MATNREDDDQELKEMYDLHIDRVDGVTEPASGMRFLVIKSESGEGGQTLDELLDHARKGVTKPSDGGDEQSQNEKLHQEAEERAKKYGISFKKGKGHLTPPKGKPTDPEQYADPVNYAYPIDEEHIRAAVAYFNQDGQREDGGYTSEEWAIIGKRIATAANKLIGDGYKFEDGKIVTPNNQKSETKKGGGDMPDVDDVLQTGGSGDGDEHAPGSAAWEQKDVELMQQAVQGLVALKGLINQIALREQAEVMHGDGDDVEQVNDLLNALDAVSFALQQVAGAAAVEQAEAEEAGAVTKAGRKMSKDSMTKVHDAMTNLAKAAGFKGVGDFHEACKSMGICKEEDDDQPDDADKSKEKPEDKGDPENTEKAKEKGKEKSEGDDKKPDDKEEPDGEDGRTETKKSEASGESLAAEAVVKALEATGLTTLAKSAGDLLKATEVIKSLEERVKAIEEQPMPGGPMLRGAATAHDYYLVRKGEGPDLNQPGVLEQAAQQVSDPYVRDVLNREVARRMHPAFRQQQQA